MSWLKQTRNSTPQKRHKENAAPNYFLTPYRIDTSYNTYTPRPKDYPYPALQG